MQENNANLRWSCDEDDKQTPTFNPQQQLQQGENTITDEENPQTPIKQEPIVAEAKFQVPPLRRQRGGTSSSSPSMQSTKDKPQSASDSVFDSSSEKHSDNEQGDTKERHHQGGDEEFVVKNGCCKECMKAFSRNGKSCLCQVPRLQRRSSLPQHGCKYCGCHGCNPIDIRKDKRRELKDKLRKEGRYQNKQQRILDSDDEDLQLRNQYDEWHLMKRDLQVTVSELVAQLAGEMIDPSLLGFGFPVRHAGYILGCSRKWMTEDEYKSKRPKFN